MEEVIGFEALYESMHKCTRNVLWKSSVANYVLNGIENTLKLEKELKSGSYAPKPICKFMITSPKPREIMSISFRDRVYQRSLNGVAVYPNMIKPFIYDNMACQKYKGPDKAMGRLELFLHKMFRKYGKGFFILQCDIHGYYPNMRHSVAKAKFKRSLDDWTYQKCAEILDGQYDTDVGFNPGSQMVQIAGISVLDDMDHFIKERLRAKCYLRYMDDFLILSNDKSYLKRCREEIKHHLANLGFEFNENKTKIYPISKCIFFMGFIFRLTETGKVIATLNPQNVKLRRKKLFRLAALYKAGEIKKSKVYECYESWKAHAERGNSCKLILRMDQYVKHLMKG